jgi:hypothetical protein
MAGGRKSSKSKAGPQSNSTPRKKMRGSEGSGEEGQSSILTFFKNGTTESPSTQANAALRDEVCFIDEDSSHSAGTLVPAELVAARESEVGSRSSTFAGMSRDDAIDLDSDAPADHERRGKNDSDAIDLDSDAPADHERRGKNDSARGMTRLDREKKGIENDCEKVRELFQLERGGLRGGGGEGKQHITELEKKPQLSMQLQKDSMNDNEASSDPQRILSDDYDPEIDACFKRGEGCPFLHLARTFAVIDNEKGRYAADGYMF